MPRVFENIELDWLLADLLAATCAVLSTGSAAKQTDLADNNGEVDGLARSAGCVARLRFECLQKHHA